MIVISWLGLVKIKNETGEDEHECSAIYTDLARQFGTLARSACAQRMSPLVVLRRTTRGLIRCAHALRANVPNWRARSV